MEQVPTTYLLVGNGRMTRHISFYFDAIGIPYTQWARRTHSESDLQILVAEVSHVLILISDDAIESFIENHPFLHSKILIHFSGSLVTALAYGVHPLMTFSNDLYSLESYKKIPFVCDVHAPAFSELFPKLPNLSHRLPAELKSRYHALCVMSNNFTTLLWQKFYSELKNVLNIPPSVIHPYLEQTLQNLKSDSPAVLTGPLVRNDRSTINMNLQALENDPFQSIYKAFVEVYSTLQ